MTKKLEVEKLKAEIERLKKELKKKKKYGLVWEEKPEEVVEMCKEKLPVLKEVKNKEIITDKDKPVNLLIEGDNYHALSVLNYTHQGKIDVIYIDPPYNTGNKDFKYNDRYVDREDSYRHSKWLTFMSKRLRLAKTLLSDEGVIFISIGDDELAQLKIVCDDVFGEENLLSIISRKSKATSNKGNFFSPSTDYILAYAKNCLRLGGFDDPIAQKKESYLKLFKYKDSRGRYNIVSLYMPALKGNRPSRYYITCPDDSKVIPPGDRFWRWSEKTFIKNNADDRVVYKKTNTSPLVDEDGKKAKWNIYTKLYLHERQETGIRPLSFIDDMPNSLGSKELIQMGINFPYSKPRALIEFIISITNKEKDIIVLDFFAGSGTTTHAVLNLNNLDQGRRTSIICTNNEENICTDVCYPRIKKVIEGYKNLKGKDVKGLGGNLKYFKTDFVDAELTDINKIKLTKQATEMLCVKEGTFEKVVDNEKFKIFKNSNHYTGIIWDQAAILAFKKAIKDIKGKFSVYIFSLGDETFEEEFEDIKQEVQLYPIPEAILRVYRRIFK
ncbi:MAG: putative methyltransferase [Bacteroidetes bacterium ADurb.Bin028]|nr:MAG: putative methyltransferase [Bacteroidetes bacterium ADurb.Bin028]